MDRNALFNEIAEFLATTFELPRERITPEADLVDELSLDSIDAVDLMVKLQEITGRKISPDEFKSVRTINDVISLAEKIKSEH